MKKKKQQMLVALTEKEQRTINGGSLTVSLLEAIVDAIKGKFDLKV